MGRKAGLSEAKLRALAQFEESDEFSDTEKLVIRYAAAMTETPAEIPGDLFAAMSAKFDPKQLVELTSSIAWENYRARFNHAFGAEAEGFSRGAYCPLPEVPATSGHARGNG